MGPALKTNERKHLKDTEKTDIFEFVPTLNANLQKKEFANLTPELKKSMLAKLAVINAQKNKEEAFRAEMNENIIGAWKPIHAATAAAGGIAFSSLALAASGTIATFAAPIIATTITASLFTFGIAVAAGALIYSQKNGGVA